MLNNNEICTVKALINNKEYTLKVSAKEVLNTMKMIRDTFDDDNTRVYVTGYDPFSKDKSMSLDEILNIINNKDNTENIVK